MTALSPRDGYARWAPSYDGETVVSLLERRAVEALGVPVAGRRLLDVGCGTGRRLRAAPGACAALRVGVDVTPEMLAAGAGGLAVAAGDVRALPIADASFDVVWCRLVLGHLPTIGAAYRELARVCAADGAVVVSDLSAESVAEGHRRTFRDAEGVVRELEHHVHGRASHAAAARAWGLTLVAERVGAVDEGVRALYADAGRLGAYDAQRGLPLVVALAFRSVA